MARRLPGKSLVLLGGGVLTLVLSGAYLAFSRGIGRPRFERASIMAEAHYRAAVLARGVAACTEHGPALPATAEAGLTCAHFAETTPPRFRYAWEPRSPREGSAVAEGDLDGDGAVDTTFRVPVACEPTADGLRCGVGPVETTGSGPR